MLKRILVVEWKTESLFVDIIFIHIKEVSSHTLTLHLRLSALPPDSIEEVRGRLEAPNTDPQFKADILEVPPRFVTTCKTFLIQRAKFVYLCRVHFD